MIGFIVYLIMCGLSGAGIGRSLSNKDNTGLILYGLLNIGGHILFQTLN